MPLAAPPTRRLPRRGAADGRQPDPLTCRLARADEEQHVIAVRQEDREQVARSRRRRHPPMSTRVSRHPVIAASIRLQRSPPRRDHRGHSSWRLVALPPRGRRAAARSPAPGFEAHRRQRTRYARHQATRTAACRPRCPEWGRGFRSEGPASTAATVLPVPTGTRTRRPSGARASPNGNSGPAPGVAVSGTVQVVRTGEGRGGGTSRACSSATRATAANASATAIQTSQPRKCRALYSTLTIDPGGFRACRFVPSSWWPRWSWRAFPPATVVIAQEAPARRPDVIYVPTPEDVVEAMLQVANVTKDDIVYDLGCGDGRIPVTAAKKYGARGVGIDIDPQRIKEANENVAKNNVGDKVKIMQADLFDHRHQRSHRRHALPAAVAQREADAEADERAEARHAHRLARLRHGRLEAREGTRRRRPQGLLLDHPEALTAVRRRASARGAPRLRQSSRLLLAVSGGFMVSVGGVRMSARSAARCRRRRRRPGGGVARRAPPARRPSSPICVWLSSWIERRSRVLLLTLALMTGVRRRRVREPLQPAGADASGYLSQAAMWAGLEWRVADPLSADSNWPLRPRPDGAARMASRARPRMAGADLCDRPSDADGAPFAIAGNAGASAVITVSAALAVLATGALARRSPAARRDCWPRPCWQVRQTFLYQSLQPMSDVPITALWIAAFWALTAEWLGPPAPPLPLPCSCGRTWLRSRQSRWCGLRGALRATDRASLGTAVLLARRDRRGGRRRPAVAMVWLALPVWLRRRG